MVGGPRSSSQTDFQLFCPLSKHPKTKDLFLYFVWRHICDFVCILMKRSKQTAELQWCSNSKSKSVRLGNDEIGNCVNILNLNINICDTLLLGLPWEYTCNWWLLFCVSPHRADAPLVQFLILFTVLVLQVFSETSWLDVNRAHFDHILNTDISAPTQYSTLLLLKKCVFTWLCSGWERTWVLIYPPPFQQFPISYFCLRMHPYEPPNPLRILPTSISDVRSHKRAYGRFSKLLRLFSYGYGCVFGKWGGAWSAWAAVMW